ncbi:MAG: amino acid adenylation protein, partial [Vicinamibacterales bacterium]
LYLAGLLVYTALTVALAAVVKRCLIGTYRPMRVPVWSTLYERNWIVQRCVRLIPWRFIEITEVQNFVLRRLGARIGRRVHLHRGVNLTQGGWDLLDVGDDVTVGQDAALQIAALHAGHLTFGRVSLGRGATLEVRAGVAPDTRVGTEASLAPWSYLASGGEMPPRERWDGVPAKPAGRSPTIEAAVSPGRTLTPAQHAAAMLAGRAGLTLVATLPWQVMALGVARTVAPDGADVWEALLRPAVSRNTVLVETALVAVALPLTLLSEAVALRLLGRVRPGVISRWSLAYVRVRLKTETLESAGRWLCGTRLWPVWLRIAGMRLGRDCEISTVIDTVPELVDIGPETFFADGILLGGPHISRGSVTLAPVRLDTRVFLGNHAVVAGGQQIPPDVLIGVCTVADDRRIRPGTSWFGQPPFQLHNREPVTCDRRLTHEPDWLRYVNRLTWEGLRFAIPLIPVVIGLEWLRLLASLATVTSWPVLLFGLLPLLDAAASVAPLALVLVTKWVLLGRVRPGRHPLWSCWCSRWDFLYVLWDFCAVPTLAFLEGSLLLNAYLRAMGVRLGRRVVLGPNLTQVADPDLLDFEDDATVDCLLQAHTFEDRVLKMDRVTVRRAANVGHAALLLYGADVGERTAVMPHSVVMKGERLPANQVYVGRPTRRSLALSAAFVGGPVSALVDQTGGGHAATGVGT